MEIAKRFILILDFDVAKYYNFGYSKSMTRAEAEEVRELIYKETGKKFPIMDFTKIGVKEVEYELL